MTKKKIQIRVFTKDVVQSSGVTTKVTRSPSSIPPSTKRFPHRGGPLDCMSIFFSCFIWHQSNINLLYISLRNFSDINLFEWDIVGGRHRSGRGRDGLAGKSVKVRQGPYKGYLGRVIEDKGTSVRVELECEMNVVTGTSY